MPPYDEVPKKFFAADRYGTIDSVPVSWKVLPDPAGIWKMVPAAATKPAWSSRQKVSFGPSQISAKPVAVPMVESEPGLIKFMPNLFTVNDRFGVNASRACAPRK